MRKAVTEETIKKLKEKVELQRENFNGKEYITVVGKVELPSLLMPNDDAMNMCIDIGGEKHIVLLDPHNIKCCDTLLVDGRKYEFICEETPEMLVVKWYSAETRANKDDIVCGKEVESILQEIDEELFNLVCMLYEGENFAYINFGEYAKVMDYEQCGEKLKIRIERYGIEYECIYDNNMPHKSKPEKLEVGKVLFFEGVFVYDKIYLKNIYETDSVAGIKQNPFKEGKKKKISKKPESYIAEKQNCPITKWGKAEFFQLPDPSSTIFKFKIVDEVSTIDVVLDRSANKDCVEPLCNGVRYEFACEDKDGELWVRHYTKVPDESDKINNMSENSEFERMMEAIDNKIFIFESLMRSGDDDNAIISLRIKATPKNIKTKENVTEFDITANGNGVSVSYACVFDKNIPHAETLGVDQINENEKYLFEGILVADKFYIQRIEEKMAEGRSSLHKGMERLSKKKMDEIQNVMNVSEVTKRVDAEEMPNFKNSPEMLQKFELIKEYYPESVQKAVEYLKTDPTVRGGQEKKILNILVNTVWNRKLDVNDDNEFLMRKLNERFYGQKNLKHQIIKLIMSFKNKKEKKGLSVLLTGASGVGKTSMFRYAAQIAGIPFHKISLNGVDTAYYLQGSPRLYENATVGCIMEAVHKIGNRGIIMLDEIDKTEKNSDGGNPLTALYNLLDPDENFIDCMIESEIDLSDIIFVCTSNDSSKLPSAILDRVYEIYVPEYTAEEKIRIARDFLIKKLMNQYEWGDTKLKWDEDCIDDIANKYTLHDGIRDIEKNIGAIIRSVMRIMKKNNCHEFTVTKENVSELLDIVPFRRDKIVHDISGLKNKFKFFKYEYSEQSRRFIVNLLHQYEGTNDENERERIRKKLDLIVNFVPERKINRYDLRIVKQELDKSHYGMQDVKERILSYIAMKNVNSNAESRCLWLDGPCGVGKTTICQSIAKALDLKFIKISLNGVESSGDIKGFSETYKDATAGKIIQNLAKAGTDQVLVLLDEIDKMSSSSTDGDPYSALLDLLDDSALFTDIYMGEPIDVSKVFFVATSNDATKIPSPLKDRMECVTLSGYTLDEKMHISNEYIIKKKLEKFKLKDGVLTSHIAKYILKTYCKDYGVRELDEAIDKILGEYTKQIQMGENIERIDIPFVKKALGATPIKRGNVTKQHIPGIARALAVSGNSGMTFAIQVTDNPYEENDEITGLPKQSTLDSIKLAKLLISKKLQKKLPPLHIHFGEGGIKKDGPSAGISIFAAMYSNMTGICIDSAVGLTGEIDATGFVWPVGGVEMKITAAENEGCTMVLIPEANYQQLVDGNKIKRYKKCKIMPISTTDDVCEILFSEMRDLNNIGVGIKSTKRKNAV